MKSLIFLCILQFCFTQINAQSKPVTPVNSLPDTAKVAGHDKSPIKSLTLAEYQAYQVGADMGMAKPAELNNYPAPKNVLRFEKDLKLNSTQKSQLKAAVEALDFKAREMGRFILQHEKKLNDLFATGKANEGSLIYYCNQIGLYQGELRNAHLQAHLKAKRILTPDQLKKYSRLNADANKG